MRKEMNLYIFVLYISLYFYTFISSLIKVMCKIRFTSSLSFIALSKKLSPCSSNREYAKSNKYLLEYTQRSFSFSSRAENFKEVNTRTSILC